MKSQFFSTNSRTLCWLLLLLLGGNNYLQAEGSKDFRDYPGYRLFYNSEQRQQLKVYAAAGETINVGASHVGITGGFITVYRPDGTLFSIFNGLDGLGIIYNDVQEINGPTGGGTTMGMGYNPALVPVQEGEEGIWTIKLEYPGYSRDPFDNKLNSDPWDRSEHPLGQRVVLAWDITVTQGGAGNMGGTPVEGRVYSNEYISIQNGNDIMTSPTFYILTKDGFQYQIDFNDTDPWGFPIFSNSVGLATEDFQPCYRSDEQTNYNRSAKTEDWTQGNKYLYEPQAQDNGSLINNKIFFNRPDSNMPANAVVTDMATLNTHRTWLFNELMEVNPEFEIVGFKGETGSNSVCRGDFVTEIGKGGSFKFNVNVTGTAKISLDFNANGIFTDSIDRTYFQRVGTGENTLVWDGIDGKGNVIPATPNLRINYKLEIRGGEVHIMMLDVENNPGGVTFTRLNGEESPNNEYYYDHSAIGGGVSGDGESGASRATVEPYTYDSKFGNNRLLDYWSYIEYNSTENGGFEIEIVSDCTIPIIDTDNDLIPDFVDLDDDNDGIADFSEYCNPEGDWVCLPGGFDPSADNDADNIANYLDSSDPTINNDCQDLNEDGICDQLNAIYDTDGDGVPDHLDLDSDNDGITDLVEAGHLQKDVDGNGIIDGDPSFFGRNGLFNALATEPDAFTAVENYQRFDSDNDGVPDYDDLDADNDGINDVVEANYGLSDSDNDGRIDDGNGNIPIVGETGLVPLIDPVITNIAIPLPPDTDVDGVADWHDLDSDNDGINDVAENIQLDADNDGIIGTGRPIVDVNGKAIEDSEGTPLTTTSNPINTDNEGTADFRSLDADGDGIMDVDEADQPDADRDGKIGTGVPVINDKGQITEDGEGRVLVPISNPEDTDSDQKPDFQDIDRDGDGIEDSYECPGGWPCLNTDFDALPDVDDLDSDNDKLTDREECPGGAPCPAKDENSLDNFLQYDCNDRNTPMPSAVIGGGSFCEGVPVTLSASGDTAFTEFITYEWTGPNGFEVRNSTATADMEFPVEIVDTRKETSGTYELIVETDRGCQSEPLRVTVDIMEKPVAPDLTVEKEKLCTGEELQLDATTYSGDEVTYEWFKQTNGDSFVIDTTNISTLIFNEAAAADGGIYTVVVNVNGCRSSVSNAKQVEVKTPIEVPRATSSASIVNPGCTGETVELMVPFLAEATYEWTGPNGFTANQANPIIPNATIAANGNYSAVITVEGCSVTTNQVAVVISEKPTTPIITIDNSVQCEGDAAALKIIQPVNYQESESLRFNWYTIGRTMPISTTIAPSLDLLNLTEESNGDYYVEVSLQNCVSEVSNTKTITVKPKIAIEAFTSASPDFPACEGDLVMLNGRIIPNATYQWFGPNGFTSDQPAPSFRNASPDINGDYTLLVNVDGCTSASEPIQVKVNSTPITPVIALDQTEPCTGENVTLRVNNAETIDENAVVTVDWYNAETKELLETTQGTVWSIERLENVNEGDYYGVLSVDGCVSEASNIQEIIPQEGLAAVMITTNAEAGISPICEGEKITLSVPMEAGINYQWYGPNGELGTKPSIFIDNATTAESGNYYVIRTKEECARVSEEITVQVSEMPDVPELMVAEGTQCFGGEVTFRINNPQDIPSGSEVTYSWYHVQTNEQVGTSTQPIFTLTDLKEVNNGTYYSILTVDGCSTPPSNVGQVLVEESTANLVATSSLGETPICEGSTVSLNVPFVIGATYEWFGPNGFTANIPNPSIPAVSMADAGNYYAVVTTNICPIVTNEVSVIVQAPLEQPTLTIDEAQKCEGETTELIITKPTEFPTDGSVVFEWYNGTTDVVIATTTTPNLSRADLKIEDTGTFYVKTKQGECESEISNEIALEVSTIPNETAFIMEDVNSTCNQEQIQIEAIQPMLGIGMWSTTSNVSIVDPLNSSTFLLNLAAGDNPIYWTLSYKGCENYSTDSTIIRLEDAVIEAKDDEYTIELNTQLEEANVIQNDVLSNADFDIKIMSNPKNGKLTFVDGKAQYEPDPNFFGIDAFEYEICNTNCPDICDRAVVSVKVVDSSIDKDCFVPNVLTPNGDGLNDNLRIPCVENNPTSRIKIFNRWGDLVHESDRYQNDWNGLYNGNPLPNGTYFYILKMKEDEEKPLQGYFTIVR